MNSTTGTYYGTSEIATSIPAAWAKATAKGSDFTTIPATSAGIRYVRNYGSGAVTNRAPANDAATHPKPLNGQWFEKCQLRCHYIHVTGPEATALGDFLPVP